MAWLILTKYLVCIGLALNLPSKGQHHPSAKKCDDKPPGEEEVILKPDFSVPPPNFFPAPLPVQLPTKPEKSLEELEYEKKVAAFLAKNQTKDLDVKIDKHLDE